MKGRMGSVLLPGRSHAKAGSERSGKIQHLSMDGVLGTLGVTFKGVGGGVGESIHCEI